MKWSPRATPGSRKTRDDGAALIQQGSRADAVKRMGRVRLRPLRVVLACAAALLAVSACGSGVSTSAVSTSGTKAAPSRAPGGMVLKVLEGDGIDGASFGQARGAVTSRLDQLLGPPTKPYSPSGACEVDHAIEWSGLHVLFHRDRFIGYNYSLLNATAPILATTAGLRYGDMLARGRQLYGSEFTWGLRQGGIWHAFTARGLIGGFVSGVVGPRGRIVTIEAGDVGCPAMTP